MKKCFKCGKIKPLSEFYKHREMADGHLNKCKECTKKDSANNPRNFSNRVNNSYDRTEKGVVRVIYKTQKTNSKRRNMPNPDYTKEELREWLYEHNFKELYDSWVKSGYEKKLKPSVDRKDDFKPYTFQNITIGTWEENHLHQIKDMLNGTGTSGRQCKPVLCFKNGVIIGRYISRSEAVRQMGYSIDRSLKSGNPARKNGFIWKYV